MQSIFTCSFNSQSDVADLHVSLLSCDSELARLEHILTGFNEQFKGLRHNIERLTKSPGTGAGPECLIQVEELCRSIDAIVVDPGLVRAVVSSDISTGRGSEQFLQAVDRVEK